MGIYNCASTLQEALDSLYAQTYQGFKIILCDDGSKDDTLKIAIANADKHENVKVIRNYRNMGLNYTLNHCLEYADTEYIARMDGDDISLPTRFEKEIKFLDEHLEYAVVSTPFEYFDENGIFKREKGKGWIKKKDFLKGSPVGHAACMARTEVFNAVAGYSVSDKLLRVEDYHLWFKIIAAGYRIFTINEPLYQMRDDRNAVSRRTWKNRRNEAYCMHVGFKMIGLPFYYQLYALIPIIKFFLPTFLYNYFHRK